MIPQSCLLIETKKFPILEGEDEEKWSWSKFSSVDVSKVVLELIGIAERVFKEDREISAVTRHDDYPFQ